MCTEKNPNRLIHEKSPYLLQHAYNPIDWYPWNEEAFRKAKQEDKPIFLSIGYSTCHWCHVMERESFEDHEVAGILNKYFVPIKVDREERPDIDHMYMAYCQVLTGAGGWPLTVILTTDKQPFFAGTYFPKFSQYGRPGMMDVLNQVSEIWKKDREKVIETAQELYDVVMQHHHDKRNKSSHVNLKITGEIGKDDIHTWGKGVIRKCYALMEKSFDPKFGGFGNAPKFPSPHNLGFLMRYSLMEPQSKALEIVERTFDGMADGGMYDHIGFGFARYSTDRYWLVPHFEKMLYDNAGLAFYYLEAYQYLKEERYARVAKEIFEYILRDMTSPEGAFYSAEDADSEGVEGKYYVWDELEIRRILLEKREGPLARYLDQEQNLADIYCEAYGISEEGNYEGKNIPSRIFSIWEDIASRHNVTLNELEQVMSHCNGLLFREREKRIRPAKDDKVLVSWNGLMIAALAKGAQVLSGIEHHEDRERYLLAAENAAGFILAKMFNPGGRLLARYREGEANYYGYLDDYAFMIHGLLELYTASGKPEYLKEALKLQQEQERLFHDNKNGGYYFTGHDAEELLIRPKEVYDGAIPSGNSISVNNLIRLWKITGEEKFQKLAEKLINTFKDILQDYPPGYTAFLQGILLYVSEGEELVFTGSLSANLLPEMQDVFFQEYRPFSVLAYQEGTVDQIAPRLKDYPVTTAVSAYLCKNFACREPVHTPEALKEILSVQ